MWNRTAWGASRNKPSKEENLVLFWMGHSTWMDITTCSVIACTYFKFSIINHAIFCVQKFCAIIFCIKLIFRCTKLSLATKGLRVSIHERPTEQTLKNSWHTELTRLIVSLRREGIIFADKADRLLTPYHVFSRFSKPGYLKVLF